MFKTKATSDRSQRLFIELGTRLFLSGSPTDPDISSELVGMKVGEYLIVQLDSPNWHSYSQLDSASLHVKYISSNELFGFESRVLSAVTEPDHLLFLSYPDVVENRNIRRLDRVECFLPVRLNVRGAHLEAAILNINRQGCLCVVNNYPEAANEKNEQISIEFSYDQAEPLVINGQVKTQKTEGQATNLGIFFDEMDSFSKTLLTTLVPSLTI